MSLPDRLRQIERRITEIELAEGGAPDQASRLLVIEVAGRLSEDQRAGLAADIDARLSGTGARALILGDGAKLARPTDDQIEDLQQRIVTLDAKVSALLAALAEEGDDGQADPGRTLDGEHTGAERDQTQSLG